MEISAGTTVITGVLAALEARHPIRGGMADTLQIVTDHLPTAKELAALRQRTITAEDGRVFAGFSGLVSVSIMLYREDELLFQRDDEEAAEAAFLELLEAAPDDMARKYIDRMPGMRFDSKLIRKGRRINWNGKLMRTLRDIPDSPDNTPHNNPKAWEEV